MIIPAKAAFYESFVPLDGKPGIIIISPAAGSDRRLYYWLKSVQADSVHFIKSSGAFRAGSVR
jgi:hypothetical protein